MEQTGNAPAPVDHLAPPAAFTAVYIQADEWIIAWLEEWPNVQTQGATLDAARANLRDALREMLAAQRDLGQADLAGQVIVHRETLPIGV